MYIAITLGRTLEDIHDDLVKGLVHDINFTYPENCKHATDVCIWLVEQIKKGKDFHIITQSDTIVNFIGHLIHYKAYKSTDVAVTIYENKKIAHYSTYNKGGILINWPFGWFIPDMLIQDNLIHDLNPSHITPI